MEVSKEVYEYVKAQVLSDMRAQNVEKRRISLEAELVFKKVWDQYDEQIKKKWGYQYYGGEGKPNRYVIGHGAWCKLRLVEKCALESANEKSARTAYLNGTVKEVREVAEQLLQVMLKED